MKVILEYDATTGVLTDRNGAQVGVWIGVQGHEPQLTTTLDPDPIASAIKLKAAGFTADEIVTMIGSLG